jgi:hypothetical protein
MAAGFYHFAITRNSLIDYGVSVEQANLIAHYASVYADGIKGKIGDVNIVAGEIAYPELIKEFNTYLRHLEGINYDIEDITQSIDDKYQLWHCTRNYNSGFTNSQRIIQTGDFAYQKLFDSAFIDIEQLTINSKEIKMLGQSFHAFQDIIIHLGARYDGNIFDEHDEVKDIFPGKNNVEKMEYFTKNAIKVFLIATDAKERITSEKKINTLWMTQQQVTFLKTKANLDIRNLILSIN